MINASVKCVLPLSVIIISALKQACGKFAPVNYKCYVFPYLVESNVHIVSAFQVFVVAIYIVVNTNLWMSSVFFR